ncbi:hypothetical protein SAMN05444365_102221 [Micromonospora pattaloongensis]|uniref:Uncharacterized protein n=1 Tax=Micromonospora pattaloongensis TaxID=405436 RepID=A0A1H3JR04_9ACTN|nr:hypothetical protein [Micromonospora pattaloongensis]SDY42363.1 hypothetical protein SAMN05444365_102221 [Micromonospora pattaloongensis]
MQNDKVFSPRSESAVCAAINADLVAEDTRRAVVARRAGVAA